MHLPRPQYATPRTVRRGRRGLRALAISSIGALVAIGACAPAVPPGGGATAAPAQLPVQPPLAPTTAAAAAALAPSPDPRVGLSAGVFDAGEAIWNLRVASFTATPERFLGSMNSDLAFRGDFVFQGNYLGFMVWDISNPARPSLVTQYVCPGSQNDVSVHGNLLFLSVEGLEGRLDCGTQGVPEPVSAERLRGVRIFDIADIRSPRLIANVQTCRGSHTHTLVYDANDRDHLYVYVSGVMPVRPPEELAGCTRAAAAAGERGEPLSHIEVIRVPLAAPEQAAIVATPRILEGLAPPPRHGPAPDDLVARQMAQERGDFVFHFEMLGEDIIMPAQFVRPMLDSIMRARGGTGTPTAADTAALRAHFDAMFAEFGDDAISICHDITILPARGLAGGACVGYGVLLDVRDPLRPRRLDAVADSNFVAWHSATFSNDGTKVVFTDEWGGGSSPKCRASDPKEWGANAIFTIENERLVFQSYYKLPAVQTAVENCVAHNGSLIPVPGRDVMVQGWYQGGISIFDFTDAAQPFEIAFHDRGPVDANELVMAGSWSVYWYNGLIINSEILRGLDILELEPSPLLSRNEIDAAKSARLDYLNVQNQPRYVWPPSFALARAYVDQLERSRGLPDTRIAALRQELADAERAAAGARRQALAGIATRLDADAAGSVDAPKLRLLAAALRELSAR
jgi:hypothetical protein